MITDISNVFCKMWYTKTMDIRLTEINEKEALRYLGYGGEELDPKVISQIDNAVKTVLNLSNAKTVYKLFDITRTPEKVQLAEATMTLIGNDIGNHLEGCSQCILMAVTLGSRLEEEIRRTQIKNMALATILDACSDAAVEQVCDILQDRLSDELRKSDKYLTARFSPGYGDMPISQQKDFCDTLDTSRKIGVTATASYILTPRKSVTAVIGVSKEKVEKTRKETDCSRCNMSENCGYRKKGITCA